MALELSTAVEKVLDIGIPPHDHDFIRISFFPVLKRRIALKFEVVVLGASVDVMVVTISSKRAVKDRVLAVAVYRYPRPSSQGPAIFIRALNIGIAAIDLVFGTLYLFSRFDVSLGVEMGHLKILVEDIVIRVKRQPNSLLSIVKGKGEIELGM